jgi:hypothetical protein
MRLTITIDRPEGSNVHEAEVEIRKILELLKPTNHRIRVTRSHLTLTEDKAWRQP